MSSEAARVITLVEHALRSPTLDGPARAALTSALPLLREDQGDLPNRDRVVAALAAVRSSFGDAMGRQVDSGAPTSRDTVLEVAIRVEDWNTLRSALVWLTGVDP